MGDRSPRAIDEYRHLQIAIIRERTLEVQVGSLSGESRNAHPGAHLTYLTNGETGTETGMNVEPLPLYLCLGAPSTTSSGGQSIPPSFVAADDSTVNIYELDGIFDPNSDSETNASQCEEDNLEDPYDEDRLAAERSAAESNPAYLAQLFWA